MIHLIQNKVTFSSLSIQSLLKKTTFFENDSAHFYEILINNLPDRLVLEEKKKIYLKIVQFTT